MGGISGIIPLPLKFAFASTLSSTSKLFVNLSLDGGPDFRHLLVPPYDSSSDSYAYNFWKYRASSHNINNPDDTNALKSRYENNYTTVSLGDTQFGVLNKCGWLIKQINNGNVAILNNTVLSTNRDHSHSIIIQESAQTSASSHDLERSGWGGRLAQQANKNLVSLSQNVRLFCNGQHISAPLKHDNSRVIDMSDSRKASLQEFDLTTADNNTDPYRIYWDDAKMKRMLKSYYSAKANEIDSSSPYYPIIQNEQILRKFGQSIDNRLKNYTEPSRLKALYDYDFSSENLNNASFGQQIRNLYDAILCQDVLNMGIASLDYGGWDSHKRTPSWIEGKLQDLFGSGQGFYSLYKELELVAPDILDKMIILVSGEFGRQLASNGSNGTDHGTGNSMLLIGNSVKGGVYGDMFPLSELGGNNNDPQYTFAQSGSDIKGLTSMQQVYAQISNWLSPTSANLVVPNWNSSIMEKGVDLNLLLSS